MEYNIYLDVFLVVNFMVNLMLLAGCSRMFALPFSKKRGMLSAVFGALMSTGCLLSGKQFPFCRFLIGVGMGRIAYGKGRFCLVLKRGILLCFATFVLSGAASWMLPSWQSAVGKREQDLAATLALLFLSGLIGLFFWQVGKEEERETSLLVPVFLQWRGEKVRLIGLYDTGNELSEPLSGRPVHIAEYEAVKSLMPESYRAVALQFGKTGILDADRVGRENMYEFTVLPYRTLGNAGGELLGIRMDAAVFATKDGEKTEEKVVIGLSLEPLSGKGRYQMIINRRLGV